MKVFDQGVVLNVVIKHFSAFCDTQSHVVTVTTIVLYFPFIYLPPSIIILVPAYVWCTSEITIAFSSSICHTLRVLATVVP